MALDSALGSTTSIAQTDPDYQRRWWILGVLAIAQLMVILDASVINIALPSAQRALHFSNDNRQWIISAYALAFGSLLLVGGRIGDLFGRKRTFIAGAIGFALASVIGGSAHSFTVLVSARVVQGVFAALLAPAALSILSTTFTDATERGRAFGIWGTITGAGGAVGLLIGGLLTQELSWRWTMFINVPMATVAGIGAVVLLHSHRHEVRPKIDWLGTVTASAGLFALVFGFSHAETHGWSSSTTLAFIAAGVILLTAFVFIQSRSKHPLLPLRIVLDRNRGGAFLSRVRGSCDLRRLPVPGVLPAADPGILSNQVRLGHHAHGIWPDCGCSDHHYPPASPNRTASAGRPRDAHRSRRNGAADAVGSPLDLCGRSTSGLGDRRIRSRHGVGTDVEHRHCRHRVWGLGCGLGSSQHHATGRWVAGYRPPRNAGGECGDKLPRGKGPHSSKSGPSCGAQLHHRVGVGSRHPRRRSGSHLPADAWGSTPPSAWL